VMVKPSSAHIASIVVFSRKTCPSTFAMPSARIIAVEAIVLNTATARLSRELVTNLIEYCALDPLSAKGKSVD